VQPLMEPVSYPPTGIALFGPISAAPCLAARRLPRGEHESSEVESFGPREDHQCTSAVGQDRRTIHDTVRHIAQ
jgi:hypothetical protein